MTTNADQRPEAVPGIAAADGAAPAGTGTGGLQRRWQALVDRVAGEVDAGWLSDWPPALVRRARASRLGRRLIAERLAETIAPRLFGGHPAPSAATLAKHAWIYLPRAGLSAAIMEVGALSLSPAIHRVVARESVNRLRSALGDPRYRRAISVPVSSASDRQVRAAWLALDDCSESADAIRQRVCMRGLEELTCALADEHPVLLERLRVVHAPNASREQPEGWLSQRVVLATMSDAGETGEPAQDSQP